LIALPKKLLLRVLGSVVIQLYAGECTPSVDRALSVAELSVAKITIKLHQLLPSCSVATRWYASLSSEHKLKRMENKALLRW